MDPKYTIEDYKMMILKATRPPYKLQVKELLDKITECFCPFCKKENNDLADLKEHLTWCKEYQLMKIIKYKSN